MAETEDAAGWEFRSLPDGWILVGLPVLLAVVAIALVIYRRAHPEADVSRECRRIVRRIGLIHCALAVQALIFLVQQVPTMRIMGNAESQISMIEGVTTTAVNPVLAIGLLRFSRLARRYALVWYAFLSIIALVAAWWDFRFPGHIDPLHWPEQIVAWKILPLFLFGVMLLSPIKRVFAKQPSRAHSDEESGGLNQEAKVARPRAVWSIISSATLLFLVVVCSNLAVDAIDWVYRLAFATESIA